MSTSEEPSVISFRNQNTVAADETLGVGQHTVTFALLYSHRQHVDDGVVILRTYRFDSEDKLIRFLVSRFALDNEYKHLKDAPVLFTADGYEAFTREYRKIVLQLLAFGDKYVPSKHLVYYLSMHNYFQHFDLQSSFLL